MPIRIATMVKPGRTVIKIDGRLTLDDMAELVRVLDELRGPVAADLSELQAIDREAVVPLRALLDSGLRVLAASPYIELLLGAETAGRRVKEDGA